MQTRLPIACRKRASATRSGPARCLVAAAIAAVSCALIASIPTPTRAQMMQHEHHWTAYIPVGGGVWLDRLYALPSEILPVWAMGYDEDQCDSQMGPPCPFQDGIAWNAPILLQWSDGGAGGEFAGGNYTCPPLPGLVHLSAQFDDDPHADEPGGGPVDTFDDGPAWTGAYDLIVWDITSPVNPPDNYFCFPDGVPASVFVYAEASTPVWWNLWLMTDEFVGWFIPAPQAPVAAQLFKLTTEGNRPNDAQNGRLPYDNSTFGGRPVWAQVPTSESETVKGLYLFYAKNGTNHPWAPIIAHSVDRFTGGPAPNWYYYWCQTPAGGDGNHV